jgi:hypothetical protein
LTAVDGIPDALDVGLDGAELKLDAIGGGLAKVLGNVCGEERTLAQLSEAIEWRMVRAWQRVSKLRIGKACGSA